MKRLSLTLVAITFAAVGSLSAPAPAQDADAFQQQLKAVQSDPGSTSEADVLKLIDAAHKQGRDYTASLAIKSYLAHHFRPSGKLMLAAADLARRAGDFPTAVGRYKGYLSTARPNAESSQAAARLYELQVTVLGAHEDAYQHMAGPGSAFVKTAPARRFDRWFITQARKRNDHAAMAARLASVMSAQQSIEMERTYYWDALDWLMEEIAAGRDADYAALADARKVAALVRDDALRSKRFAYDVAAHGFRAGSAGKDSASLTRAFGSQVVPAARAYLAAANNAQTFQRIFAALNAGSMDNLHDEFKIAQRDKQTLMRELFVKLPDDQRDAVLRWRLHRYHNRPAAHAFCSPQDWAQLAGQLGDYLAKSDHTHMIPFDDSTADANVIAAQAKAAAGAASNTASVINALAASKQFAGMVDHLVTRGSWHMAFHEPYNLVRNDLWNAYKRLQGPDAEVPDATLHKALFEFGRDHVAKSPMAIFDQHAARAYMDYAWQHCGDNANKKNILKHIEALAWVPYDERTRRHVFDGAYRAFQGWANHVRQDAKQKQPTYDKSVVDSIATIQAAFQQAMAKGDGDVAKAPNDLCRQFALAILAERRKDRNAFLKATGAIYTQVKDYDTERTMLGEAIFRWALAGRAGDVDNLDLQIKVLEEQLAGFRGDGADPIVGMMPDLIFQNRRGWGWHRVWNHDKQAAEKLAGAYEKALLAQLDRKRYSPQVFDAMRAMRNGHRGRAEQVGVKVLERMITERTLFHSSHRIGGGRSATATYMWLVRNEFPVLAKKYPPERAFDEMFVEEVDKTGYLDYAYWNYGRDEKKLVVNKAAQVLAGYATLPLGYGDSKATYTADELFEWHNRAYNADAAHRDKLLAALESFYGKGRFDSHAMGRAWFGTGSISTEEQRTTWFDRLNKYAERSAASPHLAPLPYLGALSGIRDPAGLADDELAVLMKLFAGATPGGWPGNNGYEHVGMLVANTLIARDRALELFDLSPHLWQIARHTRNTTMQRDLAKLAGRLADKQHFNLALVMTDVGDALFRGGLPEDVRTSLAALRGRVISNIGGVIPVKKSDPRYPVFLAQSNYLTGRSQAAWEGFARHRNLAMSMLRDLDPSFVVWTIDKSVELGRFDDADETARRMIQWFDSVTDGIEPELQARLLLSYANIASARKEYPRARALYERIAAAEEFAATRAQREAQIMVAEVDRITGRFDEALDRLTNLARRNDVELQAAAHYHMALVRFDQSEFVEAADAIQQVFARVPGHPDARILEGKINLKLKKLEEPTEIQVGTVTQKRFIVPGRPLKVTMEDRNLSIVGKSMAIEIRAWTDSGDEEFMPLTPFGDSRTKFTGEVPTEMAPQKKGDGTLQVLGEDVVHYDFSERFKRANSVTLGSPASLSVTTDASLLVSSGVILTEEEIAERALEAQIRKRLNQGQPAAESHGVALSTRRASNQIKPGNPINVRVIDPDRSTTDKIDEVRVNVRSSSGDRINGFVLKETDPHSGVFEGAIPTAAGQAIAYASDTEDGKEPNFAISAGDYPAWVALPDSRKPKWYAVDFNDNLAPKTMNLTASEPGRKITSFLLQTSLNGKRFRTVGSFPDAFKPWDGKLEIELVRYGDSTTGPRNIEQTLDYLERGHLADGMKKVTVHPKSFAAVLDRNPLGKARDLGLGDRGGPGGVYIAHFRGAFFNDRRQVRTFRPVLTGGGEGSNAARVFMSINGEPARPDKAGDISKSLTKGVHTVEAFVIADTSGKVEFKLMVDTPQPPYMIPAPAAMFDAEADPLIKQGVYREPATVAASEDGTAFRVEFAKDTSARVVRLLVRDFESDAPAINKIALTDRDDKQVLPTARDFMGLRLNDMLEIVPGDEVAITYQDPRVLTQGDELHEGFMSATYANATLSAAFVEAEVQGDERVTRYIPMRRFEPGDVINVFISDPDMDETEQLDRVKFTVGVFGGVPIEAEALETEAHSGVFVGKVFPVAGKPTRDGEITVKAGDDVKIEYTDRHNTDPGIAWVRSFEVEQAWYAAPEVRVYNVTSRPLDEAEQAAQDAGDAALADARVEEWVPARRALQAIRPDSADAPDEPATATIGGAAIVEVLFPSIAKSPESVTSVYAQTSTGRSMRAPAGDRDFDITVPGTIKVTATPGGGATFAPPMGYTSVTVRGDRFAKDALTDGRFTFTIPLALADTPSEPMLEPDAVNMLTDDYESLAINGGDTVYLGFEYTDDKGVKHWVTRRVKLTSDVFFDVMDRRYQQGVAGLYVGESMYLRVIDKLADVSDEKDTIQLELTSTSGTKRAIELTETFTHSGIFKGRARIVHAREAGIDGGAEAGDFAAAYGDTVTARYTASDAGAAPIEHTVQVFKGADGRVVPFTKRFKDPEIAVQTQFTVAEAYFELAKRHRELEKDDLARMGIQQGKKMLEEAIRDFPNIEARAQADYLLAELSLEFANDANNTDARKKHYAEALARFSDIVSGYPDSPYAPKAQYKKALVYEKMSEFDPPMIDKACEEYVKLSYRYPENELVAETIARLGQYFLTKGRAVRDEAEAKQDPVEAEKLLLRAREMFTTAAQVFSRLSVRFPQHNLSGKTLVLSAQCYMQADRYDKAVATFKKIIETPDMDSDLVAESMYWAGDSYMRMGRGGQLVDAYRMFKKLTWDYPASRWAKFARGRLTDERLAEIDAES